MSAKFAYNLSDEHPDIRKQMGCMNGIFQLFERHHFLSGSRRYTSQHQKRLPSSGENGNIATEAKRASPRTVDKRGAKEKHRVSIESSRTSVSSSSCSSSLSSLESTRASQLDSSSLGQSATVETHRREMPTSLSSWQSSDFRDVVKDSISRETRDISVKTATRGKARGQTLKYIDSPRPVRHQKSMEQKSSGLRESTQVLHQPRDTPCTSVEGTHNSSVKDVRRFSLDERESRETYKSTMKIKELPRFSLDSRAGSVKCSAAEMRRSYPMQETGRSGNSADFQNQQEPGSNRRPSGVVAKLMGLEAFPEPTTANSNQTREFTAQFGLQNDGLSRSFRTVNEHYQNRSSLRYLNKELASPRPVTADSIEKHPAKSRSSTEPAPWNQLEASQNSQSPGLANQVAPAKSQNFSVSVYGEIEKRLANLELKMSGKDLRAHKQILEAIQKKKATFQTESDASGWGSHSSRNECLELAMENQLSSTICSSPARGTTEAESSTSAIVIIKPAKLTGRASSSASLANHTNDQCLDRTRTAASSRSRKKSNNNSTATRDPTLKTNDLTHRNSHPTCFGDRSTGSRPIKSPSTRKEPPSPTKESTIMGRNFGTVNSKKQQNRFEVEKKSRPTTPTDSKKSSKQLTQTGLSRRKPGPKSPSMLLETDLNREVRDLSQPENSISQQSESSASMASEIDEEVLSRPRDLSQPENSISQQSESSASTASQIDEEVSNLEESEKIKAVLQQRRAKQKEPAAKSTKDKFDADISILIDQPSPVSVLEAKFYDDELPSPIKKIPTSFKGDDSDDAMSWENNNAHQSSRRMVSESSVLDQKNVDDIEPLIQHLKQAESITPELALYDHSTSEHQYIMEIVFASSFLRDFESIYEDIQLNPTDHPIKPSCFLALEEAQTSLKITDGVDKEDPNHPKLAKTQRKLLFDITNEILLQKLIPENSAMIWNSQSTLTQKVPKGLPLCQELFSELDKLKDGHSTFSFDDEEDLTRILREDKMHQSENWTKGLTEIPGLVLDIERMIFKDLITEVVTREMSHLQMRSAAHRRQLFTN